MALKATIYKAMVNVADLDRNQFLDSNLTLARHPSETQERMMLRLLAWIKYANERLHFTRGLSAEEEPEIWQRNDHMGIDLWIELGLPEERRVKKPAANRLRWRCLPIIPVQPKCGGNRIRISLASLKILAFGTWMMSNSKSSVLLDRAR